MKARSGNLTSDNCVLPRCRNQRAMVYIGHGICDSCWDKYTKADKNGDDRLQELRDKLGLGPIPKTGGEPKRRVKRVSLKGVHRHELKVMAKELGVPWVKGWKRSEAKEAVRAAMLKAG